MSVCWFDRFNLVSVGENIVKHVVWFPSSSQLSLYDFGAVDEVLLTVGRFLSHRSINLLDS